MNVFIKLNSAQKVLTFNICMFTLFVIAQKMSKYKITPVTFSVHSDMHAQ